jgi:hypothetical protein
MRRRIVRIADRFPWPAISRRRILAHVSEQPTCQIHRLAAGGSSRGGSRAVPDSRSIDSDARERLIRLASRFIFRGKLIADLLHTLALGFPASSLTSPLSPFPR